MVLILFNLKFRRLTGQAVPQPKSDQNICILVIGMIPSEIVPKGNQYEMFNSLLEWLGDLKPRFLENLIVFIK